MAIAIHDVAPQTVESCEKLMQLIRRVAGNIPLTLLVIPEMHGESRVESDHACRRFVDQALERDAEVALHGLNHLDGKLRSPSMAVALARRFLTDGEAEFAAIDEVNARERIQKGLCSLLRCGWPVRGFVPPAWQISAAATSVLREFQFEYMTELGSMTDLREGCVYRVPCLGFSARSAFRRALSMRWVRWRLGGVQNVPQLRVALHPLDARHPELLHAWQEALTCVLDRRLPVTKRSMRDTLARGSWIK